MTENGERKASMIAWRPILWAVIPVAVVVAVLVLAGPLLIIDEPLADSDIAYVVGQRLPFRSIEAASLYRDGLVAEVWLLAEPQSQRRRLLSQLGV